MKNTKGFIVTLAFAMLMLFTGTTVFGQETAEAATVNQVKLTVTGMHCGGCAAKEKAFLETIDGVQSADVDYEANTAVLTIDPAATNRDKIANNLSGAPFATKMVGESTGEAHGGCSGHGEGKKACGGGEGKKSGCCSGGGGEGKKCGGKKKHGAEH